MLSEEDKQRIREEEHFRRSVNDEISARGKGSSWWSNLNKPFPIWFLSSVMLTGITALGTWLNTKFETDRRTHERRIALASEISIRSADFLENCKQAQSYKEFWAAFSELEGPQYRLVQFKDAPMDELLYQLELLPKPSDHETVKEVRAGFKQMQDTMMANSYAYTKEQLAELCDDLKKTLHKCVIGPLYTNAGEEPAE